MLEVVGGSTLDSLLVWRPPLQRSGTGLSLIGKLVGMKPQTTLVRVRCKGGRSQRVAEVPHHVHGLDKQAEHELTVAPPDSLRVRGFHEGLHGALAR